MIMRLLGFVSDFIYLYFRFRLPNFTSQYLCILRSKTHAISRYRYFRFVSLDCRDQIVSDIKHVVLRYKRGFCSLSRPKNVFQVYDALYANYGSYILRVSNNTRDSKRKSWWEPSRVQIYKRVIVDNQLRMDPLWAVTAFQGFRFLYDYPEEYFLDTSLEPVEPDYVPNNIFG